MELKRMKKLALIGIVGGLLFAIGDLFSYLLPNCNNEIKIYTDWANMSMWRLACSLYLGCLGTVLLLIGFYSLYNIVKSSCSRFAKYMYGLILSGIALTSIGHFFIACIMPMTFKGAIQAGASIEMAKSLSMCWENYINPLKIFVVIVVVLLQSIMMVTLIAKGKIQCPKWMMVLNPIVLSIISIPISILLNGTGFEGIADSFESLGEAFMYVAVYWHWKRQLNNLGLAKEI
jgi:hypothetical protein